MNRPDFELQPSDVAQPCLLDEEVATEHWPLPPVKAWAPDPREPSLIERLTDRAMEVFR